MFKKELQLQVSCSYGPGRYDEKYENEGIDYPYSYVRWTENRNFSAILDALKEKKIEVLDLISHEFDFEKSSQAYDLIMNNKSALGVLLVYKDEKVDSDLDFQRSIKNRNLSQIKKESDFVLGSIGAGNHASRILLPSFKKAGARLKIVSSSQGLSGSHVTKKIGFEFNTTDNNLIMADKEVNVIAISTRHDSHAALVKEGLNNNKHIFVEKPIALNQHQLDEIRKTYLDLQKKVMNLN